jgi:RNA polymerase sigma-32 factor
MRYSTPHIKSTEHLSANLKKSALRLSLSEKEEFALVKDWIERKDQKALEKIIKSHQQLVKSIARKYQGYGLPLEDLMAEGQIGILQAVKGFDPDRGFRFSTYARWWIRSSIQSYVMNTWSLVKTVTTTVQKKLFFKLRSQLNQEELKKGDKLTHEDLERIAKDNNIALKEIINMQGRLRTKDESLNNILEADGGVEWQDLLPDNQENIELLFAHNQELEQRFSTLKEGMSCLNERERFIIKERRLLEPPETLESIASKLSLTKQRVHQIELAAFKKLKMEILRLTKIQKKNAID